MSKKYKDIQFINYLKKHPGPFDMRFYWQDSIPFEIRNPQVDASRQFPEELNVYKSDNTDGLRYKIVGLVRKLFSQ